MKLTHLKRWRVSGVFAREREALLAELAVHVVAKAQLSRVVYYHSRDLLPRFAGADAVFQLERMSKRYTDLLEAIATITPETLVIFDDIETVQRYPISMTRNIINHIASLTRYKIIGGSSLVSKHLYDLYAPFHILDRRILWASHYWAFKAEHREVSVFDGRTVIGNKDLAYTAKKLRPFVYFDLEPDPENETQVAFYTALRDAPLVERVQDMGDLEL